MDKKKKQDQIDMLDIESVALSTEMTGLLQTPPESPAEAIAYTELASIPVPKPKRDKDDKKYIM